MNTPEQYRQQIEQHLAQFEKNEAEKKCNELIKLLYTSGGAIDSKITTGILQLLRNYRMFDSMLKLCDALIFTGRKNYKIQRQNAQALIDSGLYSAALAVIEEILNAISKLTNKTKQDISEEVEAIGLKGRIYKQLYVNIGALGSWNSNFLAEALNAYYTVYQQDKEAYLWHGINVVALLNLAKTDGVLIEGYPGRRTIAENIIDIIEDRYNNNGSLSVYDLATIAEAFIGINDINKAMVWIQRYVEHSQCNVFELKSMLRQLSEIWRFNATDDPGEKIFPILESRLLSMEGGEIIIKVNNVKEIRNDLERNFGNNTSIDFRMYKKGYSCCESVARIGRNLYRGDGTGFLLKGKELLAELGEEWFLLTNAHVISSEEAIRKKYNALHPSEAKIIFEALDPADQYSVESLLFYSPPDELDVSIIRFSAEEHARLCKLTANITPYERAKVNPVAFGNPASDPRLYVIGHPKGGVLQFSMQDNLMLGSKDHLIHYRTPTEPGSSGSPVFDQEWQLIGIHHAGSINMPMLTDRKKTYEANEGILIDAISKKIAENNSRTADKLHALKVESI